MKNRAAVIILSLLILGAYARAQRWFTNKLDRAEAVKLASRLAPGMREEQVTSFLETNGLKKPARIGDSFGWGLFYTVSDGTAVHLDFQSNNPRPPAWTNGILQAASIQSNGIEILSITFTNTP